MSIRPVLFLLLSGFLACAPAATRGGHGRELVTRAELIATRAADLYSALRMARPEYFSPRGHRSQQARRRDDIPAVFLDGLPGGGLECLQGVAVINVAEVRRLTPTESAVRLGRETPGGALLVTMTTE